MMSPPLVRPVVGERLSNAHAEALHITRRAALDAQPCRAIKGVRQSGGSFVSKL